MLILILQLHGCLLLGDNSVEKSQCGNYGNSLSRIFGKNFVKVTVLLNKVLKSWFDEIFYKWERISRFSTLWKYYKLQSLSLQKNQPSFRQINFP